MKELKHVYLRATWRKVGGRRGVWVLEVGHVIVGYVMLSYWGRNAAPYLASVCDGGTSWRYHNLGHAKRRVVRELEKVSLERGAK